MLVVSTSAFSQDMWESEFPDAVNKFIYQEVHSTCLMADYVDGIIAVEEIGSELVITYIADFSMYGDIAQGYIAVDLTFEGDLYLSDLDCPRP